MSRSRHLRRQQAAAGLALELICLFFLGFLASSVVGVMLAWMLGMHHPEPNPLDEESRVTVLYAEGRVSWLRPADLTARDEYGGSPSCWGCWPAPRSGGRCFTLFTGDRPRASPALVARGISHDAILSRDKGDNAMDQRWQRMVPAALTLGIPLAAGYVGCQNHAPSAAAPLEKKPAQPAASAAKPAAKATRSGARTGSPSPPGMIPGAMPPRPPPSSSATSRRNRFEVPQAKSFAETPDVVLNTHIRAALMSALQARNTEEIDMQTVRGVVTLKGTVKSRTLRARAEQVARGVPGVRGVRNQLIVK